MTARPFYLALALAASIFAADTPKILYKNDFETAEIDKLPSDFLVLDGAFAVKEEAGNKFLELPGSPLDSFSVLFGPTGKENLAVSARVFGTAKGRRFPAYSVGLNGVSGYKLQVSPGKKLLEIYKGDTVKTSVPYDWESGKWIRLKLAFVKTGDGWSLTGKAWTGERSEPEKPLISWTETEEPSAGRPSISGSPFSTTPIRFDDLIVTLAP